jgi:ElaB/YqjD/DUF883 family membrane-anchored ribosome-binding protein
MAEGTTIASRTQRSEKSQPRTAEAIRQDIAAKRESISDTVDRLGERIQETFDWRSYVAQYPIAAIGVAVGAGLLVSGIFKRKQTPRERIMEAFSETLEDLTDRFRGNVAQVIPNKKAGIGYTVRAGVSGLVTSFVSELIKKRANGAFASRQPVRSHRAGIETGIPRVAEDTPRQLDFQGPAPGGANQ